MITLLTGDNSFEIERHLKSLVEAFDGDPEKVSVENLTLESLPDLLMGVSLFSQNRLIILRSLSDNSRIWSIMADWLDKVSDDTHLVLVEAKVDKRTNTYKLLKKQADIKEFNTWNERDYLVAEKWAVDEAQKMGFSLDKSSASALVKKVGADQWELFHALEKLSLLEKVTPEVIEEVIEANTFESSLNLLEAAVKGDMKLVRKIVDDIKNREDPHRLFALLSSQAFNMLAIYAAEKPQDVSKDLGVHPYVVTKLSQLARRIGKHGITKLIKILVETDDNMKSSKIEPWILVDNALIKIAHI